MIPQSWSMMDPLFSVNGSDDDQAGSTNSIIVFSLSNTSLPFVITDSGVLNVSGELMIQTYSIVVIVTDTGTPSLSSSATFTVKVLNDNDNYPQFVDPLNGTNIFISENSTIETLLVDINVTDADVGEPGNVTISIEPDGLPFKIEGTRLVVASALDYEVLIKVHHTLSLCTIHNLFNVFFLQIMSQYTVTIIAMDQGIPTLWNTSNITVTLYDLNEFSPEFSDEMYQFNVVHTVEIGMYYVIIKMRNLYVAVQLIWTYPTGLSLQRFVHIPSTNNTVLPSLLLSLNCFLPV